MDFETQSQIFVRRIFVSGQQADNFRIVNQHIGFSNGGVSQFRFYVNANVPIVSKLFNFQTRPIATTASRQPVAIGVKLREARQVKARSC